MDHSRALSMVDYHVPPHSPKRRVLMITEGTYPHVIGGVSTWCDLLINGLDEVEWDVLPILAGEIGKTSRYTLPAHARLLPAISLWSNTPAPSQKFQGLRKFITGRTDSHIDCSLPGVLAAGLLGWHEPLKPLVDALVWCRQHPELIRETFRSKQGWASFLISLEKALSVQPPEAGSPPSLGMRHAVELYHSLYWVARTAAVDTPSSDLLHVTAAGWSMIPAVVDKALHGTPVLLSEHGVYVREAYLGAIRAESSSARVFVSTRIARGLTRLAYSTADMVAPVTGANAWWEDAFGVDPERIRIVYNGVHIPEVTTPPPNTKTVISVGRFDPLKDIHTLLRVADEVIRYVPDARFLHYGPTAPMQVAYARSCYTLHQELGLGDRFQFMGPTNFPSEVLLKADIAVLTSISEGFPLAVLEAMALSRPVVATAVGGVAEGLRGCGLVAPSRDVHGLAMAIVTLLRDPALGESLGQRGRERVARRFTLEQCLSGYRDVMNDLLVLEKVS